MALNNSVKVPLPKHGVAYKKVSGKTYVYYVTATYRNEKGQPTCDRSSIGKLDEESGMLIPNRNYYEIYLKIPALVSTGIYDFGVNYTFEAITEKLGIVKLLKKYFPESIREILTTAQYMLSEGNVMYYLDGNVKTYSSGNGSKVRNFTYDNAGRLTEERFDAMQDIYSYDLFGNRTEQIHVSAEGSWAVVNSYNKNNQMTESNKSYSEDKEHTAYYYDNNGNLISENTSRLSLSVQGSADADLYVTGTPDSQISTVLNSYDGFNRLTAAHAVKNGTVTDASYTYDGNGLRQSKTVNGVTTTHLWDGMNIVAETGAATTLYYRGMGLLASGTGSNVDLYRLNAHGDVIKHGSRIYDYDAFGNQLTENEGDTNPFRYCGEYTDLETNLIYLRNRYYDPSVGRFISEDPIRDGLNWYVYCGNNPLRYVDPSGLKPEDLFATPDEVARDFGLYINEISINDNSENFNGEKGREYASSIYIVIEDDIEYYTYNEPNRGNPASVSIPAQPDGAERVATMHSHGGYDSRYKNDNFSGSDKQNADNRDGVGKVSYVVTPLGTLRKYDPAIKEDIELSKWMPYDPSHPTVMNRTEEEKKTYDSGIELETFRTNFSIRNYKVISEIFRNINSN